MIRGVTTVVWLLWARPTPAAPDDAPDPTWWHGLAVADVRLEAPNGGLPDENLETLLRAQEGQPLMPEQVRVDLATLYRVGAFSAVEADVEPWTVFDRDGDPVPGVLISYVVYPAPVVARIRVQGNRAFRDQKLLDAAGVARGQVYYAELDAERVAGRVATWIRRRGYPDAVVEVRATEPAPGRIYVLIVVDEGDPDVVELLRFGGYESTGVTEGQLRRWARRAGVAVGRPLAPEDITLATDQIREHLGTVRRRFTTPARGYISARVTPVVLPGREGPKITFNIEPGPKLVLDVEGLGPWGKGRARDALGIDHRLRITGGFLDRAPDLMERYLHERGWFDAHASVDLTDDPDGGVRTLAVEVDLGGRHTIGGAPDRRFLDFAFTFTDSATEIGDRRARRQAKAEELRLKRDLQTVFDQASPDVLRKEFYTDEEMEKGRTAAVQYFTERGHLQAELTVEPPQLQRRPTVGNALRWIARLPPNMRVTPQVVVTRGPVTSLGNLVVVGSVADVPLPWLDEEIEGRIGAPFSPQSIDQLARAVVEAHRAEGYLEAEVRVRHATLDDGDRSSTITVDPGPRILLRSIVTRGRRLTRRQVIVRTVDLDAGQPVRGGPPPVDLDGERTRNLEQIRTDLYGLGIFRTVGLELIGDEAARDLVVAVNERPRYAFEFGGGASTDQGVRTFFRATQRNLFGLGHHMQQVIQLGLDYRSENVRDWIPDIRNPEGRAAASYTAPRFPGPNQQLTFDLTLRERRQERTWSLDQSGGGASLRSSLGPKDRTVLQLGARLEVRQLNQVNPDVVLPGEPWDGLVDRDNPGRPSQWRLQEAISALLLHDLRDDPVRPSRGVLLSLNAEWAPGLPFQPVGRASFVKTEARISGYRPLGGFTLRVAAGGGMIVPVPEGVPPLEDRYRLGGTGSLRGFVRDGVGPQTTSDQLAVAWPEQIGPLVTYTTRDDPDRWVPTGGDTVADGTIELIMPLPEIGFTSWEGYALAAFVDVGNVWLLELRTPSVLLDDDLPTSKRPDLQPDIPALRVGLGFGLRVDTPVGPLQLDVAGNLQALTATERIRSLLVDQWDEPKARIHLTLGSLF